jgi:hypothetical protein
MEKVHYTDFSRVMFYNRALVENATGVRGADKYRFLCHTPHAVDNARLAGLWRKWPNELAATSKSFRRLRKGVATHWLHAHWCLYGPPPDDSSPACTLATGRRPAVFLGAGNLPYETVRRTLDAIDADPQILFFNINDNVGATLPVNVSRDDALAGAGLAYFDYLPRTFPVPSPWEVAPGDGGCPPLVHQLLPPVGAGSGA